MKNEKSVANNIMWKFAERISAQLVSLVVSVILARLLEPSHYGLISIVTIFITLANVFVSDGFGSALIHYFFCYFVFCFIYCCSISNQLLWRWL